MSEEISGNFLSNMCTNVLKMSKKKSTKMSKKWLRMSQNVLKMSKKYIKSSKKRSTKMSKKFFRMFQNVFKMSNPYFFHVQKIHFL